MSTVSAQLRAARRLPPLPDLTSPELSGELGQKLKDLREKRKISVSQVSERLKIRGQYIRALEEGHFSSIPGRIYVDGYIRNYADYLGLSSEQLVASYRNNGGGRSNDDSFMLPEITHDEMKPGRPSLLIGLLLLVVIVVAWQLLHTPEEAARAETPTALPALADKSGKALDARIVLLAKSDVEVRILGPENLLLEQKLLHAGDTYFLPPEGQLLQTEQPGYVQFFVDGKLVTPTGATVISEAGILLNPEKLLRAAGLKPNQFGAE